MSATGQAIEKIQRLNVELRRLKASVDARLAACRSEHKQAAKRTAGKGDGTRWTGPVIEPWLAGRTPGDTGLGGAARRNRRSAPGADENPAPHGGS